MKLGFIGLGIMGTPMAINLARAGHQLHVTTIGPVADELLSLGAVSVETARQVTEASDIIFIMVPDTPQVEEVLFGENGCTKASLKGKTIVDMSSISPIETKRFARQVNELGGDYLDAPVSGGEIGAREGTLSIMVGGDEAVFERVKPLFELLGKNITPWAVTAMVKPAKWQIRLSWRSILKRFLKPCYLLQKPVRTRYVCARR